MEVFVLKIFLPQKLLILLTCLLVSSSSIYAFINFSPKKLEVEYQEADVVLPNGHIIKDYIVSGEGKVFIPYELVEHMMNEPILWDSESKTLNVGNIPTAAVMSDKLKIYHYDYDSIHAFLYCPDAKTNKPMNMANEVHENGYSFTNVISASFKLGQAYHNITGSLGCEDFKASSGQVDFYLDDTLIATQKLKANDLPHTINLDVTGGNQLKLVFSYFKPDTQINFADVYID
ncbi:MAG: hypothetical protein E7231_07475 [Cellulosilyticum sp.]|nr:hypothetical protein [Cellulosilyticum sp.]